MMYRRKLIEVALPLEAINKESAREKSIRHGHPSTLHLWWARRPLAACRAVLFSQLVDDPSEYMPDEASANNERQRLFKIIEDLVLWDNINNEEVLDKARLEIACSVARDLDVDVPVGKVAIREFLATQAPPVLDPFAGGGSIPLEAQRLGLRAYASDLNPVAVLINKALIEFPPKFAGMPPVHPPETPSEGKKGKKAGQGELWKKEWKGAEGLAEDVRYYGKWMRAEAYKRIGHLYPMVKVTAELLAERPDIKGHGLKPGDELTVIAWLWARAVKCPNPACGCQMPLIRSFWLSRNKNKKIWLTPQINHTYKTIDFEINTGDGEPKAGTVNRRGAECLICGSPIPFDYIRSQGKAHAIKQIPMAIVTESPKSGRIYFPPHFEGFTQGNEELAWFPSVDLPYNPFSIRPPLYGLDTFADLFTIRQLNAITAFSDLIINNVGDIVEKQALQNGLSNDRIGLNSNGKGAKAYAEAIKVYLTFCLDKFADLSNSMCIWEPVAQCPRNMYGRQAIAMQWNFPEVNPFSESSGSWAVVVENMHNNLLAILSNTSYVEGVVELCDATQLKSKEEKVVSTDPPYYNNVDYADLSDFFYVWQRRTLSELFPNFYTTMLVPKARELVANQYRFDGNKEKAERFFESGLLEAFLSIKNTQNLLYPVTIFYAFKQTEKDELDVDEYDQDAVSESVASTGWETMLEGLLNAGFAILGTWPMRTEMNAALKAKFNSLASSIVLVCRPRTLINASITRRDFLATLKRELPQALKQLQQGSIAPVDLAQSAIGPGMAVFSRYKQVLEADGAPMRVRTALGIINQALDEFFAEQEGEYDSDTRWALAWYEQYGHEQGPYGVAETLSKAKNTSVEGLVEAGVLEARAGKVRLLRQDELNPEWDPQKDKRPTAWEACQHLIYELDKNGEQAAAALLARLGSLSETARDLAYRLYTVCERKGWAQDALGYNMLVVAWSRLRELAQRDRPRQETLL
jgi:putative DNA methylase